MCCASFCDTGDRPAPTLTHLVACFPGLSGSPEPESLLLLAQVFCRSRRWSGDVPPTARLELTFGGAPGSASGIPCRSLAVGHTPSGPNKITKKREKWLVHVFSNFPPGPSL